MYKIPTFASIKTLEKTFQKIKETNFNELFISDLQEIDSAVAILNLLYKNCHLYYDDDHLLKQFHHEKNPFFAKLIDAHVHGQIKLEDFSANFNEILENIEALEEQGGSSVHLYEGGIASSNKGYLNLNTTIKDKMLVFSRSIDFKVDQNPTNNTFTGWEFLKKIELPINAAVIVDNYIIANFEKWEHNLFEILRNLIPHELNNTFHLTLFSSSYGKDPSYIEMKLKKITTFINNLNRPFNIETNLYIVGNHKNHDRQIFSNYYRLVCGRSFDFYNNQGIINAGTYLNYFPLNSEVNLSYFNELESFRLIAKDPAYQSFFGSKVMNRLLI